jgi:hypothetical protein
MSAAERHFAPQTAPQARHFPSRLRGRLQISYLFEHSY